MKLCHILYITLLGHFGNKNESWCRKGKSYTFSLSRTTTPLPGSTLAGNIICTIAVATFTPSTAARQQNASAVNRPTENSSCWRINRKIKSPPLLKFPIGTNVSPLQNAWQGAPIKSSLTLTVRTTPAPRWAGASPSKPKPIAKVLNPRLHHL